MSPAAKIAVLTFALRIVAGGTNYPRDIANLALKSTDDGAPVAKPPVDAAALVAAAEAKAAARRRAARIKAT